MLLFGFIMSIGGVILLYYDIKKYQLIKNEVNQYYGDEQSKIELKVKTSEQGLRLIRSFGIFISGVFIIILCSLSDKC